MEPREFHDIATQTITDSPLFHCGKKAVKDVNFPELSPQIKSHCSWEKIKTVLVGEYHLILFLCRLVISTPLLNVDSGMQRFPDGGCSMTSGYIEFTANSVG